MSSVAPTSGQATPETLPAGDVLPGEPDQIRGRLFSINLRQSGIYVAFALIVVLFAVLTHGDLLTQQNISNIVVQNSYILILAIGIVVGRTVTWHGRNFYASPMLLPKGGGIIVNVHAAPSLSHTRP